MHYFNGTWDTWDLLVSFNGSWHIILLKSCLCPHLMFTWYTTSLKVIHGLWTHIPIGTKQVVYINEPGKA
jgi:hypothetical protein